MIVTINYMIILYDNIHILLGVFQYIFEKVVFFISLTWIYVIKYYLLGWKKRGPVTSSLSWPSCPVLPRPRHFSSGSSYLAFIKAQQLWLSARSHQSPRTFVSHLFEALQLRVSMTFAKSYMASPSSHFWNVWSLLFNVV